MSFHLENVVYAPGEKISTTSRQLKSIENNQFARFMNYDTTNDDSAGEKQEKHNYKYLIVNILLLHHIGILFTINNK